MFFIILCVHKGAFPSGMDYKYTKSFFDGLAVDCPCPGVFLDLELLNPSICLNTTFLFSYLLRPWPRPVTDHTTVGLHGKNIRINPNQKVFEQKIQPPRHWLCESQRKGLGNEGNMTLRGFD